MRRLVNVLGVPVDDVTMSEAIDLLAHFVEAGRSTGRVHQVTTVNVDFVVNAVRDPSVMEVLRDASLSLPDGMPIIWGSRLLGTPLRERVAGADLVGLLAARAATAGFRIYLFGAGPGIAERAAQTLREQFSGLDVVADAGPIVAADGTMDDRHLAQIIEANPDIVCVALGNPKQEHWIRRYGNEIGAPVFAGVGGTLDLIVGEKRRAPVWVQKAGLEWLFRTAQEPRRLAKRYAVDLAWFLPRILRQARIGRRRMATTITFARRDGGATLELIESRARSRSEPPATLPDEVVTVDISRLDRTSNQSASILLSLAADARSHGRALSVCGATAEAQHRLRKLGVGEVLDETCLDAPSGRPIR